MSRPDYSASTLRRGTVTITVNRPNLSADERKKRERETVAALSPIMAGILAREYGKESNP